MASDNQSDSKLITEIYDYLKSKGFLEQLRLECVADVKKKPAYQELKLRICNFLTKRLSNGQWSPEKERKSSPTRLKEQIAECGLLAMTVERVVDEVVSQKLLQLIRPMINEIVTDYLSKKDSNKKVAKKSKSSPVEPVTAVAKTSKVIEKTHNDSDKSSKKKYSSPSKKKKKSESEESSSELESQSESESETKNKKSPSKKSSKQVNKKPVKKSASSDSSDAESVAEQLSNERTPRKRRPNPRYSSDMFESMYTKKESDSNSMSDSDGSSACKKTKSETTVSTPRTVSEIKSKSNCKSTTNSSDRKMSNSTVYNTKNSLIEKSASTKTAVVQCHKLPNEISLKKTESKPGELLMAKLVKEPDGNIRKRGRQKKKSISSDGAEENDAKGKQRESFQSSGAVGREKSKQVKNETSSDELDDEMELGTVDDENDSTWEPKKELPARKRKSTAEVEKRSSIKNLSSEPSTNHKAEVKRSSNIFQTLSIADQSLPYFP